MQLANKFLGLLGVRIERRPVSPDVTKVESVGAIGPLFDADALRQELNHSIAMRGAPSIPTNADELGRDRGSYTGSAKAEWLQ